MTPRINHRNSALINSVVILPLEIPRPRVPMLMESLWITLEWLTIEMIVCSNTTRLHGLARIRIYCRIGMNWDSRSWLSSTELEARLSQVFRLDPRQLADRRSAVIPQLFWIEPRQLADRVKNHSFKFQWDLNTSMLVLGVGGGVLNFYFFNL